MRSARGRVLPLFRAGHLLALVRNVVLAWRLLKDRRVPKQLKILAPGAVLGYLLLPTDLVPDYFPVLGQVDDLGVLLLALMAFVKLAPREIVFEHEMRMAGSWAGRLFGFGKSAAARKSIIDVDSRVSGASISRDYRDARSNKHLLTRR